MKVRHFILKKISEAQGRHITACEQCGNQALILGFTDHKGKKEFTAYCPECHWDIFAGEVNLSEKLPAPF